MVGVLHAADAAAPPVGGADAGYSPGSPVSSTPPKRTCGGQCRHYLPHLTLCSSAALLITAIVTGLVLTPSMVHKIVGDQAVIKESMKFYKEWKNHGDSTANISLIYHMWNVTNSEEVMRNGSTPVMEPLGPFVYQQRNYKDNVTFSSDGNQVFYTYTQQMFFDRARSAYDEDTVIVMPNLALIAAIYRSANAGTFCPFPPFCGDPPKLPFSPAGATALNTFGLNYKPHADNRELVGHTVREWLWGFQEPTVTVLQDAADRLHLPIKTQEWISLQFNDTPDMWNHTTAQWTGKDDHGKSGSIFQWEGCRNIGAPAGTHDTANATTRSDYTACEARTGPGPSDDDGNVGRAMQWYLGGAPNCSSFGWDSCPANGCRFDADEWRCLPSPQAASRVEGTDGYQQYPHLKDGDHPYIFLDQAFRKFKLHRTGSQEFHGIDTGRWEFHPDTFKSAAQVPANEAYLQYVDGLMNLSRAQAAPVYVSKPLFAESTAGLADKIVIKESARELAESLVKPTYFLVEPWTGMSTAADINLQMNLEVEDLGKLWGDSFAKGNEAAACINCTQASCIDSRGKPQSGCFPFPPNTTDGRPFSKNMSKAYYPLVNIHQNVFMTDHTVSKLKSKALLLIDLGTGLHKIGAPIFLAVGLIQLIFGSFLFWKRRQVAREFSRCEEKVAEYERLLGDNSEPKVLAK